MKSEDEKGPGGQRVGGERRDRRRGAVGTSRGTGGMGRVSLSTTALPGPYTLPPTCRGIPGAEGRASYLSLLSTELGTMETGCGTLGVRPLIGKRGW